MKRVLKLVVGLHYGLTSKEFRILEYMQIKLTIKNYRCFTDINPAKIVLRKGFTAFIGVNNAGKTTLLKFFYEFRTLLEAICIQDLWRTFLYGDEHRFILPKEILDSREIFCNSNNQPLIIELDFIQDELEFSGAPIPKKLTITVTRDSRFTGEITAAFGPLKGEINFDRGVFKGNNTILAEVSSDFLAALEVLSQTLYIGSFRNVVNLFPTEDLREVRSIQSLHAKYFDINVGLPLIQQWRESKTGSDRELAKRAFSLQKDIERIFGFKNVAIDSSNNDRTIQFFIDGQIYGLSELGAGISQFFLILANVVLKRPSYILIDEPELNLHPSLQLDFLTTLGNYAKEGVLFSTHSIGLARASAEQIYVVHKDLKDIGSKVVEFDSRKSSRYLTEFLGELSFSAYREFGFNKICLVEGPTDVKIIQQFLRKHGKDHEILILPLGGNSLINRSFRDELQEIKRISEEIYVLIDSEKGSSNAALPVNRKEFAKMCKEIGIECHILERRAIENYFPDHAVKAILGSEFSSLENFESLSGLGWSKTENWRMAKEMTLEDLASTDLGDFIEKLIS